MYEVVQVSRHFSLIHSGPRVQQSQRALLHSEGSDHGQLGQNGGQNRAIGPYLHLSLHARVTVNGCYSIPRLEARLLLWGLGLGSVINVQ